MEFLLPYLPVIIPILVILIILPMGYVKAPPDQAYIISGLRENSPHPHWAGGRAHPLFGAAG